MTKSKLNSHLTSLHKRLKKSQRLLTGISPEEFGLRMLAIYRLGYRDGYKRGHADGWDAHRWHALAEDVRRRCNERWRHLKITTHDGTSRR